MSNFLTNLIARSLAPPPELLRPKLPSLFEAPADSEPILEESLYSEAQERTVESVPDSATDTRAKTAGGSDNHPAIPPQAELRRATPARKHLAPQTILPSIPEPEPHLPIKIQSRESLIEAQVVRAENDPDERKQMTGPRPEAVLPSPGKSDQAESSQGISARVVPLIPKLEPSHSSPPPKSNLNENGFASEDKSPTVHIRIGRIEVRAVTQPSPPARSIHPNRPKMTLDEYLLRRNESKR